jgi:hypothetical protein
MKTTAILGGGILVLAMVALGSLPSPASAADLPPEYDEPCFMWNPIPEDCGGYGGGGSGSGCYRCVWEVVVHGDGTSEWGYHCRTLGELGISGSGNAECSENPCNVWGATCYVQST